MMKRLALLALLGLTGCFNGNGDHATLDLGGASLGRQLIDLKEARDAGAITAEEHDSLKKATIDAVLRLARPEAED